MLPSREGAGEVMVSRGTGFPASVWHSVRCLQKEALAGSACT